MILFDSHCHLQGDAFDADRPIVLSRAQAELSGCVVVGDTLASSRAAAELCGGRVFAAVGVHPYHAGDVDDAAIEALAELAQGAGVVAIGEIGLDYFRYCETPRAIQKAALVRQLRLAAELALPVVIHNRDADEDILPCLDEQDAYPQAIIMHCFGSDEAFAKKCIDRGYYISFAGNVSFPKAEPLRRAARIVPADRLLVETDSPYLAPQPVRGKRCEPPYVRYTVEALAKARGVAPEELAEQTARNAARVFGVALAAGEANNGC